MSSEVKYERLLLCTQSLTSLKLMLVQGNEGYDTKGSAVELYRNEEGKKASGVRPP